VGWTFDRRVFLEESSEKTKMRVCGGVLVEALAAMAILLVDIGRLYSIITLEMLVGERSSPTSILRQRIARNSLPSS
jgi:hypothetical protein